MTDPRELTARGWSYHDVPWTPEEDWNSLLDLMGPTNYEFLACTRTVRPGEGVFWRGQVFISPEGKSRLKRARRILS